jgi:diguanylate cyclase (GGDEF)-like protein
MTKPSPSGPNPYAQAPTSAQRRQADRALRFEPELEAVYVSARLLAVRALVRMACLLGLAVAVLRVAEHWDSLPRGSLSFVGISYIYPGVMISASMLMAWMAWRPAFPRRYLLIANFAAPARSIFAASAIAALSARGHIELLMLLPAMILSLFFFLGLRWTTALASASATLLCFAVSALAYELPMPLLLRTCGFLLTTVATSAVAAWQFDKQARVSFLDSRQIAHMAEHDALTGAKNRRVFDDHLARLWRQSRDDSRGLAIVLIDVDHFKAFNDLYGHQAGDVALSRVANALRTEISRPLDILARYGGEEFAAILYDVDAGQAREIAERMRQAVSDVAIEHRKSPAARVVTISIGVAAIMPAAERQPRGALQLADEALYTAKVSGRNRVHLAADTDYSCLETGVFVMPKMVS